jgi:hypothetical protein
MHNNNHTPGPWTLGDHHRIESPTPGGGCVLIVSERKISGHTGEQQAANARLIAAAPCMLLALTIARAHIRRALEEIPENDGNLSGALAVIGEAITKATGGDFE